MPSPRNKRRQLLGARWLAVAVALAASIAPAFADLVGSPATAPPLSATERALVAANPALADIESRDAWVLRTALDDIDAAARGTLAEPRGSFVGLDPADADTIGKNPALLEVYRSAPEAAVDLLALIRAAGGKRPNK
jgi:hypothetical protein